MKRLAYAVIQWWRFVRFLGQPIAALSHARDCYRHWDGVWLKPSKGTE
ncbi:hypothetical protein [Variovorax sp. GB1P17]